jgi:hypothetical protein
MQPHRSAFTGLLKVLRIDAPAVYS